ncbi:HAL/PAL/TAL family ammonia-lyase [Chelatococcus reniformis]|uniref:Histidine ammonia-lyase n=1 Tax=Chelatococcus reniformis TaxID=1494448 RepID=A0A916TXK8_9HYPH|nr:aromatic amino acid ammonia-lyase [Chelatococcus reniformis]GGC48587.1 histidine ammonia-lyase [Chelatococcus reniformis]
MTLHSRPTVVIGARPLAPSDIWTGAHGFSRVEIDSTEAFYARIEAGSRLLNNRIAAGERIYGVTTGFGESVVTEVPAHLADELALNLVRFHGVGTGAALDETEASAVLMARAASLATGWSGVRFAVLERLTQLLQRRVLPVIPCEGSVGASGDLTPLSYVAAVLMGEREVYFQSKVVPAAHALAEAGLRPVALAPKESLAIMNGSSVSTALASLAFERARWLARLAAALTAMASDVTGGNPAHFDPRIFAAKPHPGQRQCAAWIADDVEYRPGTSRTGRLQDRYSIRCGPHVIGVLLDAIDWMQPWLETELNGASDNPLIDPETGDPLFGGNFYGGHVCFVADGLKNAVANVADLLDRQLALICSASTSNGLPENLVGAPEAARAAHHGFKAMQIAASALTAEALKATMPASVFSRSTENHNQDKVSMSTVAARDSLRVVELSETVAAICLIALAQAVDLRKGEGCHGRSRALRDAVRAEVAFNDRDVRQDGDIAAVKDMIRRRTLPLDFS